MAKGPRRDLNPGPPPPKGGIIPLDHRGCYDDMTVIEIFKTQRMKQIIVTGFGGFIHS